MRLHHYPGLFGDPRSRGLTVAVAASLVVHIVLFATAGRFRTRVPERTFFAPVDLVDWVEPKAAAPVGVPQKQPPAPPPPAEKAPPKPPPAPVQSTPAPPKPPPTAPKASPTQKTIPKEPATPTPPPEPRYSEEDVAEKIARMREKLGTQSAPAATPPAAAPEPIGDVRSAVESIRRRVSTGGESGTGPATSVRSGGTNALQEVRLRAYYERLWEHVRSRWQIPSALLGHRLETLVWVTLHRDGRVQQVVVEESSGSKAFDDAVVRSILRASPFPGPLPDEIADEGVGFRVNDEGMQR